MWTEPVVPLHPAAAAILEEATTILQPVDYPSNGAPGPAMILPPRKRTRTTKKKPSSTSKNTSTQDIIGSPHDKEAYQSLLV